MNNKMEVTIISTFEVDMDKIMEYLPLPPGLTIAEKRQCIKDTLVKTFEASVKEGFEGNECVRLVFSILEESEGNKP